MTNDAVLKCPGCGFSQKEEMPLGFCQLQFICGGCQKVWVVKEGECCVFCKYSDAFCPTQQERRDHCCGG